MYSGQYGVREILFSSKKFQIKNMYRCSKKKSETNLVSDFSFGDKFYENRNLDTALKNFFIYGHLVVKL